MITDKASGGWPGSAAVLAYRVATAHRRECAARESNPEPSG